MFRNVLLEICEDGIMCSDENAGKPLARETFLRVKWIMTNRTTLETSCHAREKVRETLKLDPASEYETNFGALAARFERRQWAFSSVALSCRRGQSFGRPAVRPSPESGKAQTARRTAGLAFGGFTRAYILSTHSEY